MNRRIKSLIPKALVVLFLLACVALPAPAYADIGPKPSVRIRFENMGDALCYATLLSSTASTGPASAWDGTEEGIRLYSLDREIWQAFEDYEDTDGYYFLQEGWRVDESKSLAWTYYPPYSFKVLLYYPDSGEYLVSGIYERYAFDSYFTIDLAETDDSALLSARQSYDFTWEMISFVCRICLTILLEMAVAALFGFRTKRYLLPILWVNTATQILLNLALNVINYREGGMAYVFFYILLELAVFVVEAILFRRLLCRVEPEKVSAYRAVGYAFVANAFSFALGLWLSFVIPGIF